MKKVISTALVLVLIASMSIGVYAAPAPKAATVSLSASELTVKVNESVTLTAATLKQGSGYTDSWTGVDKVVGTVLNTATGYYVSTSTFKSATAGKYTITYDITMNAGKSGVVFVGKGSTTITVVEQVKTVIGATIKNVSLAPVIQKLGSDKESEIIGYEGTGAVYALWSDGTVTDTGVIAKIRYGRGEPAAKMIEVTFDVGGVSYTFETEVIRN